MGINEKVTKQSPFRQGLKWAIIIVIFAFMGKMVWDHWNEVKDASFTLRVFPFVLGTCVFAFSHFVQLWAWYLITLKMGVALSFRETLASWFYSQLGKYVPGKVWLLLSRFFLYESKGKSKQGISIALYFEAVTVVLAAGLLSLMAIFFSDQGTSFTAWRSFQWFLLLLPIVLVLIHPRVLEKMLNSILRRFKKPPISLPLSYLDILWILFICVLAWGVGGIGFYLFVDSIVSVSSKHILFLSGALAFSSTLGLMAFFAPGGLGVREGILVYLLSHVMPGPVAVIISILTRLWMTLIEIGLIGVIYLMSQTRRGPTKKEPHA